MIRLNGWQRLWIVVAILYAFLVLAIATTEYPNRSRIDDAWARQVIATIESAIASELKIGYVNVRDKDDFRNKSDIEIAERFSKGAYEIRKDGDATSYQIHAAQLVKELNEKRTHDLEGLPTERAKFLGIAFLSWAIPLLAIYLIGVMVAWVIRGFKASA